MDVPRNRYLINEERFGSAWRRWMPIRNAFSSDFTCRNQDPVDPISISAGQELTFELYWHATHPGSCFMYIGDEVTNEWFKIWSEDDCQRQGGYTITIPPEVPPCEFCQLRWEFYALHLTEGGSMEWYANCVDVSISSDSNCLPTEVVQIPGHLPNSASDYWRVYSGEPFFITGPSVTRWNCDGSNPPSEPESNPTERPEESSSEETSSESCVSIWEECTNNQDGCCDDLSCVYINQWYSQCEPRDSDDPEPEPDFCIDIWEECTNNQDGCCDDLSCVYINQWYSQCEPRDSKEKEECVNIWEECTNNQDGCCDDLSCVYINQWYSQCQ